MVDFLNELPRLAQDQIQGPIADSDLQSQPESETDNEAIATAAAADSQPGDDDFCLSQETVDGMDEEEKHIRQSISKYFRELNEACKANEATSIQKKRSYQNKKRKRKEETVRLPRSAALTRLEEDCVEGILGDLKVNICFL